MSTTKEDSLIEYHLSFLRLLLSTSRERHSEILAIVYTLTSKFEL